MPIRMRGNPFVARCVPNGLRQKMLAVRRVRNGFTPNPWGAVGITDEPEWWVHESVRPDIAYKNITKVLLRLPPGYAFFSTKVR